MTTMAIAKFTVPGLHHWPDAPAHRHYLRAPHRHLFWFDARVEVQHVDRAIEIHDLRDVAKDHVRNHIATAIDERLLDFGSNSCEAIAHQLAAYLRARYTANVSVSVLEDGEAGGAVVIMGPKP